MAHSVLLQEIADITLGFNIGRDKLSKFNRHNVIAPHDYSYQVLSLKAFNNGIYLNQNAQNTESLSTATPINEKFLVQENDILIKLIAPVSALFVQNSAPNAIFPHSMVKITLKSPAFSPKFLAFYLNSSHIKRQLKANILQSTSLSLVKISDLARLLVPQIPLAEQEKALKILDLSERKNDILHSLIKVNQSLSKAVLSHFVGENSHFLKGNS